MSDYRTMTVVMARPPLPVAAFRSASCLRVATLTGCSVPDDVVAQGLRFPRLKKLGLECVGISEGSLQSVIAAGCCPVLECLLLGHSFGSRRVRIKSASIRSIGVCTPLSYDDGPLPSVEEIFIDEAPSLERLVFLEEHRGLRVSIKEGAAPKLETLGCLNGRDESFRFVFGSTVIQVLCKFLFLPFTVQQKDSCY